MVLSHHTKCSLYNVWLGSNVNKPSKLSVKTLSAAKYIELDIQNIVAPRKNDPII